MQDIYTACYGEEFLLHRVLLTLHLTHSTPTNSPPHPQHTRYRELSTCRPKAAFIEAQQQHSRAQLEKSVFDAKLEQLKEEVTAMRDQFKDLEIAYEEAKQEFADCVERCKAKLKEAIETLEKQWIDPDDHSKGKWKCVDNRAPKALVESAWKTVPDSEAELLAEIQSLTNQLTLMGDAHNNSQIVRDYKEAMTEKTKAVKALEKFLDSADKDIQELEARKAAWLENVQEMCSKINIQFGRLFKDMSPDMRGEVKLHSPADFRQCGIQIRVCFRKGGDLDVLGEHAQSGGERAVSTMIYLLAIQQLTRCPMRMVDEINQGMDATFERSCYNAVNKLCNSQFWIFSPKLLMNRHRFEYHPHMTVLLVHQGSKMIPSREWNLDEYITKLEKQRKGTGKSPSKNKRKSSAAGGDQAKKQKARGKQQTK